MFACRASLLKRQRLVLPLLLLLPFACFGLAHAQAKRGQAAVTRKPSAAQRRSKAGKRQRRPGASSSKQETRAMAQAKIDSQLLYVLKIRRGEKAPVADTQSLLKAVHLDEQGRALIDVDASVSDELLREIQKLGGEIVSSFKQFNAIRVNFPIDKLEDLAALKDIKFIRAAAAPALDAPDHGL